MPGVIVKLCVGRSEQEKTRLAAELTKAVTTVLAYGDS
jgi:phenylpyruvate tautomerase PptA (4-oxalocrotonate tautomerase family)